MASPDDAAALVRWLEEKSVALMSGHGSAEASAALLRFRSEPRCFEVCQLTLERSTVAAAQFQAVSALQEVVLAKWSAVAPGDRAALRDSLWRWAVEHASTGDAAVVNGVLRCYAACWKRGTVGPGAWPLRDVFGPDLDRALADSATVGLGCAALRAVVLEFGTESHQSQVSSGAHEHLRHAFETNHLLKAATVAFGALAQLARALHGQAHDAGIVVTALRIVELCRAVLEWDFGGQNAERTAAEERVRPGAAWRAVLLEQTPAATACAWQVHEFAAALPQHSLRAHSFSVVSLLASLSGAIVSDPQTFSSHAANVATIATALGRGAQDDGAESLQSLNRAAQLAAKVIAGAGGVEHLGRDVSTVLLQALSRALTVALNAADRGAAEATQAVARALHTQSNVPWASTRCDDAKQAMDDATTPLLEAWGLLANDPALVIADAMKCDVHGPDARAEDGWLRAMLHGVGASFFAPYVAARVSLGRAAAAIAVAADAEEDASDGDPAEAELRGCLADAAALARCAPLEAAACVSSRLLDVAKRLDTSVANEFERDADLEEACILVYVAGEFVADDDDAGETPSIPLALHAAALRDARCADAVALVVHAVVSLVEREVQQKDSSPALGAALAWFVRRWAAAYALYAGASPRWVEAYGCASASAVVSGAVTAATIWLVRWPGEPRVSAAAARLLGGLARCRGAALAPVVAAGPGLEALLRAHGNSLATNGSEAGVLAAAIRRLGSEQRSELTRALADCALAADATDEPQTGQTPRFDALAAPLEAALAAAMQRAGVAGASELTFQAVSLYTTLYGGVARVSAPHAVHDAQLAQQAPARFVARAFASLAKLGESQPAVASATLRLLRDVAVTQLCYMASASEREALFGATPVVCRSCLAHVVVSTDDDDDDANDDLEVALELVEALLCDDVVGHDVDETWDEAHRTNASDTALETLLALAPKVDANLLCRRVDAARRFFGALQALIDLAPEHIAQHANVFALVDSSGPASLSECSETFSGHRR
ncbi:hypothetical protein M885DRAFT_124766 [Pelagophyceae sp. CCMP2097]|nr:hypothetical protein M885DRAFT_124766 [Pelagophyceae sp. CCMP2097]